MVERSGIQESWALFLTWFQMCWVTWDSISSLKRLDQGWRTFPAEGQMISVLGLWATYSLADFTLPSWSERHRRQFVNEQSYGIYKKQTCTFGPGAVAADSWTRGSLKGPSLAFWGL